MRILRVHNRYQQPGGEDAVYQSECDLLESHGHNVYRLVFTNDDISDRPGPVEAIRLVMNTVWSRPSQQKIAAVIDEFNPDLVHFDNFFPVVSPAAYSVARKRDIAVVQTLHNYRLLCPSATLFFGGKIYEDNLGKLIPLRAVLDGVYRNSRSQTAAVAAMLTTHRLLRTWHRNVDCFISLTEFSRQKFIDGGLDAMKIVVKPNFAVSGSERTGVKRAGFLFVGRLSPEKGIETLVSAQKHHNQQLRVVGDGPSSGTVESHAHGNPLLTYLGRLSSSQVTGEMDKAVALVFPSEWYEGFPMTIVEAFSSGLPVIASRLGSMAEIVSDGETGLLFDAGSPEDLAAKISWAASHPEELLRMGENARREYKEKYTPERNYALLMGIYERSIGRSRMANVQS